MHVTAEDFDQLLQEHAALLRTHGEVQARCTELIREQAEEIARLNAQVMRLRMELVKRETALAWAKDDRAALDQAIPDLPKRVALARQVEALQARVRELSDEMQRRDVRQAFAAAPPVQAHDLAGLEDELAADLATGLAAADLVICQTGCMSHGAYWRVQDHCKRTGKACVLVEKTDALQIVRIHRTGEGEGAALVALQQG